MNISNHSSLDAAIHTTTVFVHTSTVTSVVNSRPTTVASSSLWAFIGLALGTTRWARFHPQQLERMEFVPNRPQSASVNTTKDGDEVTVKQSNVECIGYSHNTANLVTKHHNTERVQEWVNDSNVIFTHFILNTSERRCFSLLRIKTRACLLRVTTIFASVETRYRPAKRYAPADGSSTGISTVQPPGECLWSGAGDGFVAVSVTSGGRAASPTSEFDFQRGASY